MHVAVVVPELEFENGLEYSYPSTLQNIKHTKMLWLELRIWYLNK